MKYFRICWLVAALAMGMGVSVQAHAWPERPLKFVVPYAAGSMGDNIARLLSEELRGPLGQPVVVENRAGAGGNIGGSVVARARNDGYTFLIAATNNLVINQFLYRKLDHDPLEAFEPVTFLVNVPSVLFVHPSMGKDFRSFNAQALASRGRLNFGSPGTGTTPHLSMQAIDQMQKWDMTHVAYQGAGPAVTALLAGEIHAYLGGAGLGLQHVQSGRLVAVAQSSGKRLSVLPDTPTFAEIGLGSVKASNWWAMVAPKGTPDDVVQRMNAALREAMARPSVADRFEKLGVQAYPVTPRVMADTLKEEAVFWQRKVAEAGVSLD